MEITLTLLLIAGPIGGFDVIYFHLWKFQLYKRRQSVKEEITHLFRASLFPIGLGILLVGRPTGSWFWAMVGLLTVDFCNSLLDVLFEPASRAPLGVPPSELAVHFFGITLMGAASATFMVSGWDGRRLGTALEPYNWHFLPAWAAPMGWLALIGAVVVLFVEGALFLTALSNRTPSASGSQAA